MENVVMNNEAYMKSFFLLLGKIEITEKRLAGMNKTYDRTRKAVKRMKEDLLNNNITLELVKEILGTFTYVEYQKGTMNHV